MAEGKNIPYLISLIGQPGLEALAEAFGGLEVLVPSTQKTKSFKRLANLIGTDEANRLAYAFGRDKLYIPKLEQLRRDERNAAIQADYRDGLTEREMAIKYGVSMRWIRNICARYRAAAGIGIKNPHHRTRSKQPLDRGQNHDPD